MGPLEQACTEDPYIPNEVNSMNISLFEESLRLEKSNTPFAVASIIRSAGSTPRTHAKMIITNAGETIGTIGGGVAESYVIGEALDAIHEGRSRIVEYRLDSGDSPTSIGMLCGGNLDIFIEVFLPARRLVLIGGGHVNLAIAQMAERLGFMIDVVETREEFCTPERFPMAANLYCDEDISKAVGMPVIDAGTAVIIATHDHDNPALDSLIGSRAGFLGMLGSRRKVAVIRNRLLERGVDPQLVNTLRAPLGLDIGSETPEEIALSIMAEVLMVLTGSTGRPLRERGNDSLVIVRGAGDIATGTIHRLFQAGFRVLALETAEPTVIRRTVAFASAVFEKTVTIDGVTGVLAEDINAAKTLMDEKQVAVLVDPDGAAVSALVPGIVVDAILAKKNLGTNRQMAPIVIGLGPGFTAGEDVDAVIETMRGHSLGRVIYAGSTLPNTGIPGTIAGYSSERVLRAPGSGSMQAVREIGDTVAVGDAVAYIGNAAVTAQGAADGRHCRNRRFQDRRYRSQGCAGQLLYHLRQGAGGCRGSAGGDHAPIPYELASAVASRAVS